MKKFMLTCLITAILLEVAISFKIIRSKRSAAKVPRVCLEPPDTGPCRAAFDNYYYNTSTEKCETFTYGGCQGNKNNFWNKEVCEDVCSEDTTEDESEMYNVWEYLDPLVEGLDDCEYPANAGPCRALIPQYFFNGNKCKVFTYGGCGGNPNRFDSKEECMKRCGARAGDDGNSIDEDDEDDIDAWYRSMLYDDASINDTEVESETSHPWNHLDPAIEFGFDDCDYPLDEGPCRASDPKYFFDGNKCELFNYSGCGGNPNRFDSKEECMERCGARAGDDGNSLDEDDEDDIDAWYRNMLYDDDASINDAVNDTVNDAVNDASKNIVSE